MNSSEIQRLIQILSKLPSLGPRSARRIALHLLENVSLNTDPLIDALINVKEKIVTCANCFNLDTKNPCYICTSNRDKSSICIVETVADLWAIERAQIFKGIYFVLGGSLCAIKGFGPEKLKIEELRKIITSNNIQEAIFALSATLEGQTTMHYIRARIKDLNISISNIAQGIPVGGELDYLDDGTLATAIEHRYKLIA